MKRIIIENRETEYFATHTGTIFKREGECLKFIRQFRTNSHTNTFGCNIYINCKFKFYSTAYLVLTAFSEPKTFKSSWRARFQEGSNTPELWNLRWGIDIEKELSAAEWVQWQDALQWIPVHDWDEFFVRFEKEYVKCWQYFKNNPERRSKFFNRILKK